MSVPDDLFSPGVVGDRELPTQAAGRFAGAGLSVFPVDMRPGENHKGPLYGYAWKQRATSDLKAVVDDIIEAEQEIGSEFVGIAWALGPDRRLAVDLDGVEPVWWGQLGQTARNVTKRGEHLIFDQPPGRRVGNGTSRFPSQGWGELRGVGGYIVIWWPGDRPGFDVAELARVAPFPHPEWLTDSGEEADAVSPAELEEFVASHTVGRAGRIKGFEARLAEREPGASRNMHATTVACWMAREAAAGLVPAREAFACLEGWWAEVAQIVEHDTEGRLKTRKLRMSEVRRIECWAVGQLTVERVAEVRAKADASDATWRAKQAAQEEAMFGPVSSSADIRLSPPRNLPEDFWQRPELAVLRAWAHGRGRSADAVYGAVRARVAALVSPSLRIDTTLAAPVSLNALVALVAKSGGGKTTAAALARELVPFAPAANVYEGPLGSGEGVVEAFYDWVAPAPPSKVTTKQRTRVRDAALLLLDEGEALGRLAERSGATVMPTLRSAWSGEIIGQSKASKDTRRLLEAGSYRLVLLMGLQVHAAAELLGGKHPATGSAQRLVLFAANDPSIPKDPPSAPTPVLAGPPTVFQFGSGSVITLAPAVLAEVRQRGLAVQRGELELDDLDAHRDVNRLKEAAVLAVLAGRTQVTDEDWALAGMVMDTSDALRAWVLAQTAAAKRQDEDQRAKLGARRQVVVAQAVADDAHERAVDRGARAMSKRAARSAPSPALKRELSRAVAGRDGTEASFEEMIERAEAMDWLRPTGDGSWVVSGSAPT